LNKDAILLDLGNLYYEDKHYKRRKAILFTDDFDEDEEV